MIYNGVETSVLKKEYININTPVKFLFIGRIDIHHKGIDILLDALSQDEEFFLKNIEVYLVGPYETKEDENTLHRIIEQTPYLKRIVNIEGPKYGNQKEIYYRNCDIFIHTSRYEGMPVAVLEAMSRGMACALTKGTNLMNILEESSCGFILPDNSQELANVLKKVVEQKEKIPEMGESAFEWSINNLSWDKISKKYASMYHDACQIK